MNRKFVIGVSTLALLAVILVGYILTTSSWLLKQNTNYRYWAKYEISTNPETVQHGRDKLLKKARFYIETVEEDFLLDGMVINRDIVGNPIDVCDSLLFTSLYYVSLKKLGFDGKAAKIWSAIEKSQYKGRWLRHPKCLKPTSRDMMVGLLAAFSQNPPNLKEHFANTINFIEDNRGFFSNGRLDVSYLTPGVAEFFRIMADANGLSADRDLPLAMDLSFATSEFSALTSPAGYRSHLVAIQTWLELELTKHQTYRQFTQLRNALRPLDKLSPLTGVDPSEQRSAWIAQRIYTEDPENLFFKYLRLSTAGALSPQTKNILISELLNMQQFPDDRSPEDCDRKADYLWQRSSAEYYQSSGACTRTYNGVDFVWMAALLLEEASPMISQDEPKGDDKSWN